MKWCTTVFVLGLSVSLTGCYHKNPLKTNPKEKAATFLMQASANVETRLQFPVKQGDLGVVFLECMDGKKSPNISCEALYQGMVAFAEEGHYPAFKGLQLSDLKDKAVFEILADLYAEIAISRTPTLYPVKTS